MVRSLKIELQISFYAYSHEGKWIWSEGFFDLVIKDLWDFGAHGLASSGIMFSGLLYERGISSYHKQATAFGGLFVIMHYSLNPVLLSHFSRV